MSLSLISAVAKNNCIGKNNALPWTIPEDLKHFKDLTTGKIVLMGRKTWESIPERWRPLPNRTNVVITHQDNYPVPNGVLVFSSIEKALAHFQGQDVMSIGGATVYAETINLADTLYITHVDQTVDGDAFFPVIDPAVWRETARENHPGFSFVTYTRLWTANLLW